MCCGRVTLSESIASPICMPQSRQMSKRKANTLNPSAFQLKTLSTRLPSPDCAPPSPPPCPSLPSPHLSHEYIWRPASWRGGTHRCCRERHQCCVMRRAFPCDFPSALCIMLPVGRPSLFSPVCLFVLFSLSSPLVSSWEGIINTEVHFLSRSSVRNDIYL